MLLHSVALLFVTPALFSGWIAMLDLMFVGSFFHYYVKNYIPWSNTKYAIPKLRDILLAQHNCTIIVLVNMDQTQKARQKKKIQNMSDRNKGNECHLISCNEILATVLLQLHILSIAPHLPFPHPILHQHPNSPASSSSTTLVLNPQTSAAIS